MFGVGENPVFLARQEERRKRREARGDVQREEERQLREVLFEAGPTLSPIPSLRPNPRPSLSLSPRPGPCPSPSPGLRLALTPSLAVALVQPEPSPLARCS